MNWSKELVLDVCALTPLRLVTLASEAELKLNQVGFGVSLGGRRDAWVESKNDDHLVVFAWADRLE